MPYCPKCKDEFREGFTACNTCEIPLVDQLPPDEPPGEPEEARDFEMIDDVPALLCNASNNIEADMIESLLGSYNIPVMKRWRYGGDIVMLYTGASSTGADLYVPSKLLEDAKALLSSKPTAEADDEDTESFAEYAKQQEQKKQLFAQKLLLAFIALALMGVLLALVFGVFMG